MARAERLRGVQSDELLDRVLPALRGHIAIRSGELLHLAQARGLVVPSGDDAARAGDYLDLVEALAGVVDLATVGDRPPRLLAVIRDLTDAVEGPSAPVPWWRALLGQSRPAPDPRQVELLAMLRRLAEGLSLPTELTRAALGRLDGALSAGETQALLQCLDAIGREQWLQWAAGAVNAGDWATCFDVLHAGCAAAVERHLGLVYGAGY